MIFVVLFIVSVGILVCLKFLRKPAACSSPPPPEPKGHPLFGNLFGCDLDKLHLTAAKWVKTHGDIFTGSIFGNTFVFLNDANLLRKAFSSDEYGSYMNSRPPMFAADYIMKNSDLITSPYSAKLLRLRKVFHGALDSYGGGLQRFEQVVQTEINRFLSKLERTNGQDFSMKIFIRHTLSNVVSALKSYCADEKRGVVDCLLYMKENREKWLTDAHIEGLVQDVIGASLLTSYVTLSSFFLVITQERDIQRSIQAEIDTVIGNGRLPKIEDRDQMPYTKAAILEILRYSSNVPLAVPHQCSADVEFEGYRLRKGTMILPNLWCIHHNDIWEDPWVMDPRRFLDDHGDLIPIEHPKRQNLLPFGIGRRHCPGEALAKTRLFLYITNMLQMFDFLPAEGSAIPSHDPRLYQAGGTALIPPDYKCRIRRR